MTADPPGNKKRKKPDDPEPDSKLRRKRQKAGDCVVIEREEVEPRTGSRLSRRTRNKAVEEETVATESPDVMVIDDQTADKSVIGGEAGDKSNADTGMLTSGKLKALTVCNTSPSLCYVPYKHIY